jgi:predicted P-loop ATPase/GTPase
MKTNQVCVAMTLICIQGVLLLDAGQTLALLSEIFGVFLNPFGQMPGLGHNLFNSLTTLSFAVTLRVA